MTSHHYGPPTFRNGLILKAGNKRRTSDDVPDFVSQYIPVLPTRPVQPNQSRSISTWESTLQLLQLRLWTLAMLLWSRVAAFRPRDLLDTRLFLVAIWIFFLLWGEENSFTNKVQECAWEKWERWPTGSSPHHVVLIADPQLVDPHTYPGRPWPLSALTIHYTDLYIKKSFQRISNILFPHTIFFLGDLFDGGREWTNDPIGGQDFSDLESKQERWRKYGQRYWLKEYHRFSRIFFEPWYQWQSRTPLDRPKRRLIVDLPGNHDLGLGDGIRVPVRKRFNVFFGEGNRVDVIGNHTFVSLDTVSLSAKGQQHPGAGTQGVSDDAHSRAIWEPTEEFLHNANALKARAVHRALRTQNGLAEDDPQDLVVLDLSDEDARMTPIQSLNDTEVPSIILSHVPFFRPEGTPCGPLRERFPPSKSKDGVQLEKDLPNAIPYWAGDQYQNVLTSQVSRQIIEFVSGTSHIFSGDDHDYCELVHHGYNSDRGAIREVTVKSISWAMGVRKPGFLLVSLWNPVDVHGNSIDPAAIKNGTVQSHLCLLPNQLSIFASYAYLFILTLLLLLFQALLSERYGPPSQRNDNAGPILPLSRAATSNRGSYSDSPYGHERSANHSSTNSSSSSADQQGRNGGLSTRSHAGRMSRGSSPGYGLPATEKTKEKADFATWSTSDLDRRRASIDKQRRASPGVIARFRRNLALVALVVCTWYSWLLWHS